MHRKALAPFTVLFFLIGLTTCLNDILVPFLKKIFSLDYASAALVQASFFGAYGLASLPASHLLEILGYKKSIVLGFILSAAGCGLLVLATESASYPVLLAALFVIATGIVVIQVSANPYVTLLGPVETSSSRLSLLHSFFSLGTFIAPFVGAVVILDKVPFALSTLKFPYLVIGGAMLTVALLLSQLGFPHIEEPDERSQWKSVLKTSGVFPGMIAIFLYVGAEVSIGSFLVNYIVNLTKLPASEAANFVALYWGSAMAGRFMGLLTLREFHPARVLGTHALLAISLILISTNSHGMIAVYAMVLVGFVNSIMFPTIVTLTLRGLGAGSRKASGLLSASTIGGAILPFLTGQIADLWGLRVAMAAPLLCYLYLWIFGNSMKAKDSGTTGRSAGETLRRA